MARVMALVVLSVLTVVLGSGCTTFSAGRKYTMVKKDRDGYLIERNRVISAEAVDDYDAKTPGGTLGVKLNSGFIRYLQATDRPEVAIFVRVRIRPPQAAGEGLVWQKVYLASEDEAAQIALNDDSSFPRADVTLLPPVDYQGEDVLVELRVIELDQADNARARQLINSAASIAATFQPEAAAAVSVFQTALTFITENNADDIEFNYDFQITEQSGKPVSSGNGWRYDQSLGPRKATYAIVKSEHPERFVPPSRSIQYLSDLPRFALVQLAKFGTLGVLNWSIWPDPEEDRYSWIFARPLQPDREAFAIPHFDEGKLVRNNLRNRFAQSERQFVRVENMDLVVDDPGFLHASIGCGWWPICRRPPVKEEFRDQAYLIVSVESPNQGTSFAALEKLHQAKDVLEELHIRTSQLSPEEFGKSLEGFTNSVRAYLLDHRMEEECSGLIANASSPAAVTSIEQDCLERRTELAKLLTGETRDQFATALRQQLAASAARRRATLSEAKILNGSLHNRKGAPKAVEFIVHYPAEAAPSAQYRAVSADRFTDLGMLTKAPAPLSAHWKVKLPAVPAVPPNPSIPAGRYELRVVPQEKERAPSLLEFQVFDAAEVKKVCRSGVSFPVGTAWDATLPVVVTGTGLDGVKAVRATALPTPVRLEVTKQDGTTLELRSPKNNPISGWTGLEYEMRSEHLTPATLSKPLAACP